MSEPYQSTSNQPVGATPPGAPYQQAGAQDPGKTLGIVGLVLAFVAALIGVIVSAIALNKSKKAGFKNTPALIGIIVGSIITVLYIGLIIAGVAAAGAAAAAA